MRTTYLTLALWSGSPVGLCNFEIRGTGSKSTLRAKLDEAAQATRERKRVMLYLDPKIYESLKTFAAKRRLSMNVAATLAVESMLESEDA